MLLDKPTDHDFYCESTSYYSNAPNMTFETVTDFLDSFEMADIDMNYVFRFDISHDEDTQNFSVFIAMMLQRKGIYKHITCKTYDPATEGERLHKYLEKHFQYTLGQWKPFMA